jgi:esterase/lipase superfamily enzyme
MRSGFSVRRYMALLLVVIVTGPGIAGAASQRDAIAVTASAPADSAAGEEETTSVSVFYVTNRSREPEGDAERYGGERGQPRFGRCQVEFVPIPVINDVAPRLPFYLQRETSSVAFREQPGPAVFWNQFGAALGDTASGTAVLFVHGYNYGFERTCRMAAQMQRSLQDGARVVVFSWPSNGLPSDYVRDQADIEWSVPLLAQFIEELGARVGKANVRVVAHSLGSRGVIFALQRLAAGPVNRAVIGDLVLLAPDFDSQTFVDLLPELAPLAGAMTLYASSNDTPLKLSRQLSGYPRLGEAGEYLTLSPLMDTIDVSSLGRYQFTGHEYFYFHPVVSADLVMLLRTGARAAERPGLQAHMRNGGRYWVFRRDVRYSEPRARPDE